MNHSFFVTSSGEVLASGRNESHELAVMAVDHRIAVPYVTQYPGQGVKKIVSGEDFTLVLYRMYIFFSLPVTHMFKKLCTDQGHVLACGSNAQGQISANSQKSIVNPIRLAFPNKNIDDVACGSYHTLVLLSKLRVLFVAVTVNTCTKPLVKCLVLVQLQEISSLQQIAP